MADQEHWEDVYTSKAADQVSWYQASAEASVRRILRTQVAFAEPIIDVGEGASVLADALLRQGFSNITVLDLSQTALNASQARLGDRASEIRWLHQSVLNPAKPVGNVAVWHDRAVFHFMTTPAQRQAYVDAMVRAVMPGCHAIIATFAADGPAQCSGLPVVRYSPDTLAAEFSPAFSLVSCEREVHTTPWGAEQSFTVCHLRRAT